MSDSQWVDFAETKKAVSLEMVINRYGIELRRVGAGTVRGRCPLPMHGTDHKNRASFTATFTKGVGGVWACQSTSCIAARNGKKGGNALDFVSTMEGCTIREAAVKLAEWFRIATPRPGETVPKRDPESHTRPELVSKEKSDGAGERAFNKPLTFTLQNIDYTHPYLQERGITEKTAREFGVGVFRGKGTMQGRCVIPIHSEKGELVAYAGRSLDATDPKYKFPAGFHKSLELFNLHRVIGEGSVVLVEGFFGCMIVSQATGWPCVALMGSTMSTAQEDLLAEYFGQIIIMLDGDAAGRRATEEIRNRLQQRVLQVKVVHLADGRQPDELFLDQLRAAVFAPVADMILEEL